MKNPINKSFKLVFFFFCLINAQWFHNPVLMENQGIYWLVGNITYVISANLIIITLYDRMVRPERVIGSGGRVMALTL